jgi:DNA mismatch repair ATPase MutS
MKRAELKVLYRQRSDRFSKELADVRQQINGISNLRLIVALLLIATIYFSFVESLYFLILTAALLVAFLALIKHHAKLFEKQTHLGNLVTINDNEKNALDGNLKNLDPGNDFIDPHHPYSHDLDIFGPRSLYQYLNRCTTYSGKKKFANLLSFSLTDRALILHQQEAIKDVHEKLEFRQHFQAAGMESGEQPGDTNDLLRWTKLPSIININGIIRYVLVIIPLLTIGSLIGYAFNSDLKILVTGMILTQWIIAAINLRRVNAFHEYVSKKRFILQRYAKLLAHLEKEKFDSEKMKAIGKEAQDAAANVAKLASLVSGLNARNNSLAALLVNGILLYDLQFVYRLEKWKSDHAHKLSQWLDTISEAEVILSYGNYAFNNAAFTYPSITDELRITATDLAHPLIDEQERVPSTLMMGSAPTIFIITGANMAGKSTFLRTVGVNLILALNGAPVCATSFECPIIQLRTGMRTADSLQDHQSYFYAELNRLKTIMDELRLGKPLLILLDEILKGTNSTDKQAGSIALVKQLLPYPCLGMIATHDLALGELETEFPKQIQNFCFEANIVNDQLHFDYKLKTGLATKMNASFLMKKMGIIP